MISLQPSLPLPKKSLGTILILAALAVSSPFLFNLFAHQPKAAASLVAVPATPGRVPLSELHIANDGMIFLRDATVVSTAPGLLQVSATWSGVAFNWVVKTDENTKFVSADGQPETLGAIEDGDLVTVTGQLTGGGAEPTIAAQFVRE